MRAGITVKAGKGLKIVGTPDRKSPIEAGINNPNAVSNVTTVPRRSTFTGTLLKLHHIADHEDGIIGENRSFHRGPRLQFASPFASKWTCSNSETIQKEDPGNECGFVSEFVDFFQPTTQPTRNFRLI
jgi:hypothetical protein